MATAFPHVQFRSLDIAPIIAHVPRPKVIFEVYDFTRGLLLDDNSQDTVFLHHLAVKVKDYRTLIREVHRVLRPGGLLHVVDFSLYFWDPENETPITAPTNPKTLHLLELVQEHLSDAGIDTNACTRLSEWLNCDSDLWNSKTGDKVGFNRIEAVILVYTPSGSGSRKIHRALDYDDIS
ncbi:methyltransferase domain protein [Ceratobasidium sp. AG-Ba]|nr:methyltransferase domain protein [Ceratobasidium sp. AG-Ba]